MSKAVKRIMQGIVDLTGDTFGDITVVRMVSRHPAPRYEVKCGRCGTTTTDSQQNLTNGGARCLNAGCGKQSLRDAANDTPRKAREREQAAESERSRRIEAKRAAEFAEMETGVKETARKLGKEIRQAIAAGRDPELFVSEDTRGISMSQSEANDFNAKEAERFAQKPEFQRYRNSKTIDTIVKYLDAHKVMIVSTETLQKAFERLRDFGLLEMNQSAPQPVTVEPIEHQEPEPPPAAIPQKQIGYDSRTGEQREFTPREVALMGSEEYRRAFRVYAADLVLPNRAAF